MGKPQFIHILSFEDIQINASGNEYRHILFEDINNHKKVDYVIFSNSHMLIWIETLKTPIPNLFYPGEIISFEVTQKVFDKFKSGLPLTIKEGDVVDIIVWYWSNWDDLSDEARILRSFKDQIWRFRSFPRINE
jgi:hypothetical protein